MKSRIFQIQARYFWFKNNLLPLDAGGRACVRRQGLSETLTEIMETD